MHVVVCIVELIIVSQLLVNTGMDSLSVLNRMKLDAFEVAVIQRSGNSSPYLRVILRQQIIP
jgi:hypothetical protein